MDLETRFVFPYRVIEWNFRLSGVVIRNKVREFKTKQQGNSPVALTHYTRGAKPEE